MIRSVKKHKIEFKDNVIDMNTNEARYFNLEKEYKMRVLTV
jgi:hypothetical protein